VVCPSLRATDGPWFNRAFRRYALGRVPRAEPGSKACGPEACLRSSGPQLRSVHRLHVACNLNTWTCAYCEHVERAYCEHAGARCIRRQASLQECIRTTLTFAQHATHLLLDTYYWIFTKESVLLNLYYWIFTIESLLLRRYYWIFTTGSSLLNL
jgi:hypothetical protein